MQDIENVVMQNASEYDEKSKRRNASATYVGVRLSSSHHISSQKGEDSFRDLIQVIGT